MKPEPPSLQIPGHPELPPWRRPAVEPAPRPVFIPQVAESLPSPPESIPDRLLERRIVLLTGPLTDELATDVAARLMLLDAEASEPIRLEMSCPRAELDAALTLMATIDTIAAPVHAVAGGTVGGAALGVYAAGSRRFTHQHTVFTMQEPRVQGTGTVSELVEQSDRHRHQLQTLVHRIAAACGRTTDRVAADLRAGRLFDAEQAVAYGLADEVIGRR